ncbi:ABC transporter substrate-binding protein [Halalkalibacter sp. APA_J-10(15)]|uniref:ABC transporter substrate-binding protein n=1 Tax=Halalkalibacter sp. APA_J-10(15) TaxID=2933805 RepID=UPI001FF449D3|nr:ABC transporter substrate-binding protein [Halalkalibacter sp. APA_J-10(15)]MCK0472805.1 ABC transporter substrate-binding protein [Halalkalibacter sp. APA_J-10(15)]
MKKLMMTVCCSLFLAIILVACGEETSQDDVSEVEVDDNENVEEDVNTGEGDEDVTLRISWWGSQDRHDSTLEVISMYEEENPHVTIEPEFIGWDGYWERLSTQAAGNNLPDIIQLDEGGYLIQYVERDLIADIMPFIEDGTIDVKDVAESAYLNGPEEARVMGLGGNALGIIIDPALFEAAGVDVPEIGYTWDEFEDILTTISDELGIYGTGEIESVNVFPYYLRQHGQTMFNEDTTEFAFDDELFVDFFEMKLRLQEAGAMSPPEVNIQHSALEDLLLVHEKAAMAWKWSANLGVLESAANRDLELLFYPGPNPEQGMYEKRSMMFGIAETSENQEEAAKFINYFINDLEVNQVLMMERGVSPNSVILEELEPEFSSSLQKTVDYLELVQENSSPSDLYPVGIPEVNDLLLDVEERILYQAITAEEGVQLFKEEGERILNRINNND